MRGNNQWRTVKCADNFRVHIVTHALSMLYGCYYPYKINVSLEIHRNSEETGARSAEKINIALIFLNKFLANWRAQRGNFLK